MLKKSKMGPKTFLFRKCLYSISTHLSQSDIDKLKFMLDDDLPRAQLESASSGFDLFCLMEARNLISQNNLDFLKDVLGTVSKEHYIDRYIVEVGSSGDEFKRTVGVSCGTPPASKDRLKKFLGRLGDAMTAQNVHDLALFFHGTESSISLKDAEKMRSADQVFRKLLDMNAIHDRDMTVLYNVLDILGRLDLCGMIEEFYQHEPDHAKGILSTAVLEESSTEDHHYPVFLPPSLGSSSGLKSSSTESSLDDRDNTAMRNSLVSVWDSLGSQEPLLSMPFTPLGSQEVVRLEQKYAQALKQLQSDSSHYEKVKELEMALRRKVVEVSQLQATNEQLIKTKSRGQQTVIYEMKRRPHGVAVVIVNEKFDNNPNMPELLLNRRVGAPKDLELFQSTFTFLGYDVRIHCNLTSGDIGGVIDEVASLDHSLYDSFVCCASTHGNALGLYGTDSVLVKLEELKETVKNIPTLVCKPKMFFIQSCRVDNDVTVMADRPQSIPAIRHPDADFYVVNATTPMKPAYISPNFGSWFCQALKNVFTNPQVAHTQTLQDMINMVAGKIQECVGQVDGGETVTQCLHRDNTLTKNVVFFSE